MKFTLRDLLWLIAILAIACAWFADHRYQAVVYSKDAAFWNRSTSAILKGYRELQAENEKLKAAMQQQSSRP